MAILLTDFDMITHYFTLLALSKEIETTLRGSSVLEIYSQQKNQLGITLREPRADGEMSLCISVDPRFNYCFLRGGNTRAKKNSVDLLPTIIGTFLETITVVPYERILQLHFSNDVTLIAKLYNTSDSNVLLLNANNIIIEAFKNNKTLQETEYQIEKSRFDASRLVDSKSFERSLTTDGSQSTLGALKQSLPMLGAVLAKETLSRARIDEKIKINQLSDEERGAIFRCLQEILASANNPLPQIYIRPSNASVFSVIQLQHLSECKYESFVSVNFGIRSFVQSTLRTDEAETHKELLYSKLTGEMHRLQRSVAHMDHELNDAQRSVHYEQIGKLLTANLHHITKGESEISLSNIFDNNLNVRILLVPKLTPVQNAERYFVKAKKSKTMQLEIERRREHAEKRLLLIKELLEELGRCLTGEQVKAFKKSHQKELTSLKLSHSSEESARPPFRLFTVVGGFEVWVGKNSANNDLLTMKYAKPNDLWFHARGASGSHTVLRIHSAATPSKEAIYQAASIAAYFSKMRKARNVPVAYCARKFVRKPKGSHAGTVVLEREKVVFVQPRLPQS